MFIDVFNNELSKIAFDLKPLLKTVGTAAAGGAVGGGLGYGIGHLLGRRSAKKVYAHRLEDLENSREVLMEELSKAVNEYAATGKRPSASKRKQLLDAIDAQVAAEYGLRNVMDEHTANKARFGGLLGGLGGASIAGILGIRKFMKP